MISAVSEDIYYKPKDSQLKKSSGSWKRNLLNDYRKIIGKSKRKRKLSDKWTFEISQEVVSIIDEDCLDDIVKEVMGIFHSKGFSKKEAEYILNNKTIEGL